MNCFIFFTHPDSSADESSLSSRREARLNDKVGQGEEGESVAYNRITVAITNSNKNKI